MKPALESVIIQNETTETYDRTDLEQFWNEQEEEELQQPQLPDGRHKYLDIYSGEYLDFSGDIYPPNREEVGRYFGELGDADGFAFGRGFGGFGAVRGFDEGFVGGFRGAFDDGFGAQF